MDIQKEELKINNQFQGKKIGIWGFGVGGQSAARFFAEFGCNLSVLDANETVQDKVAQFSIQGIHFYFDFQKEVFFEQNDFIFVSSGVDIAMHYTTYRSKFIFELDIFAQFWKKPIVAITGTLGKTSVTTFLAQMLTNYGLRVALGGNIGVGCFDLLAQQDESDLAVLELSSFQLQYCQQFWPTVGIFTNFYPNHLDRHTSESEYFEAKYSMFARNDTTRSVMPLALFDRIAQKNHRFDTTIFFSDALANCPADISLLYLKDNAVWLYQNSAQSRIIRLAQLPPVTFATNWAILVGALIQLGIDPCIIASLCNNLAPIEHRVELVAKINEVTFYNDSKSTTIQATRAAIEKLQDTPIHLFLGGLSKGVDRSVLLEQLNGHVYFVYCFGAEAEQLFSFCATYNISARAFATLDAAFEYCIAQVKPGHQVLLSPSGSSYDLFLNYEERGKHFKKLVKSYDH